MPQAVSGSRCDACVRMQVRARAGSDHAESKVKTQRSTRLRERSIPVGSIAASTRPEPNIDDRKQADPRVVQPMPVRSNTRRAHRGAEPNTRQHGALHTGRRCPAHQCSLGWFRLSARCEAAALRLKQEGDAASKLEVADNLRVSYVQGTRLLGGMHVAQPRACSAPCMPPPPHTHTVASLSRPRILNTLTGSKAVSKETGARPLAHPEPRWTRTWAQTNLLPIYAVRHDVHCG
jgi:hypothetical protein